MTMVITTGFQFFRSTLVWRKKQSWLSIVQPLSRYLNIDTNTHPSTQTYFPFKRKLIRKKMSPIEKKISTASIPVLKPQDSTDSSGSETEYDSDADEIEDPWCVPERPRIVGFEDITAASFRIRNGIIRTPCDVSCCCCKGDALPKL